MSRTDPSFRTCCIFGCLVFFSVALAHGQQTGAAGGGQPAPESRPASDPPIETGPEVQPAYETAQQLPASVSLEAKVLSKMHQKNQMEIKAGQLAIEKGTTELIRSYGKRLVNDHSFGDRKVQNLAAEKGIELLANPFPPEQQEQAKQKLAKLQQLSGPEFDQFFLNTMKQGHQKAIQMLNESLTKLQDPEVQRLVALFIPILEQHLALADDLQARTQTVSLEQTP